MKRHQVVVIGGGPAGMMAAMTAARRGREVTLLEQLPHLGAKLLASGGGRCNLSNTLAEAEFVARFGRQGRFLIPALRAFSPTDLRTYMAEIGVRTHAPDGRRVFPVDHAAVTVATALRRELERLGVRVLISQRVRELASANGEIQAVHTSEHLFPASEVVLATGGLGYPSLGATGDGYTLSRSVGHSVTSLHPGMVPLRTRETWVSRCRADTIGCAELRCRLAGKRTLKAVGDLIFTADGIRGPVVLDFAREITPLLAVHGSVSLSANLIGGRNEEQMRAFLQSTLARDARQTITACLAPLLPSSVSAELSHLADIDPERPLHAIPGFARDRLLKVLSETPLTVIGHGGWEQAMITRGGVSLKEIRPETLESRRVRGLFFCGEIVDLDGPCGGCNLQGCFSSGYLAGHLGRAPSPSVSR